MFHDMKPRVSTRSVYHMLSSTGRGHLYRLVHCKQTRHRKLMKKYAPFIFACPTGKSFAEASRRQERRFPTNAHVDEGDCLGPMCDVVVELVLVEHAVMDFCDRLTSNSEFPEEEHVSLPTTVTD